MGQGKTPNTYVPGCLLSFLFLMLLGCELLLAWQELNEIPSQRYPVHKTVVHAYDHFNFPPNQNIYLLINLFILILCMLF
jgi:hypothetical protein